MVIAAFCSVAFSLISQNEQIRETCPMFFEDAGWDWTILVRVFSNGNYNCNWSSKNVLGEWIFH